VLYLIKLLLPWPNNVPEHIRGAVLHESTLRYRNHLQGLVPVVAGRTGRAIQVVHTDDSRLVGLLRLPLDLLLVQKKGRAYQILAVDNWNGSGLIVQKPAPEYPPTGHLLVTRRIQTQDDDLAVQSGEKIIYRGEIAYSSTVGKNFKKIPVRFHPPYAVHISSAQVHAIPASCILREKTSIESPQCDGSKTIEVELEAGTSSFYGSLGTGKDFKKGHYCTVIDFNKNGTYEKKFDITDGCIEGDADPSFEVVEVAKEIPEELCELLSDFDMSLNAAIEHRQEFRGQYIVAEQLVFESCRQFGWGGANLRPAS